MVSIAEVVPLFLSAVFNTALYMKKHLRRWTWPSLYWFHLPLPIAIQEGVFRSIKEIVGELNLNSSNKDTNRRCWHQVSAYACNLIRCKIDMEQRRWWIPKLYHTRVPFIRSSALLLVKTGEQWYRKPKKEKSEPILRQWQKGCLLESIL